jgi:hypothetical protein
MTQMVGRALRGTKFGGTPEAYIVFFTDNWKQTIHWAEWDPLAEGQADEEQMEYGKRPPFQLISIELLRKLAREMDSGNNIATLPFLTLLPVGWYGINYSTTVEDSEDTTYVQRLIMVFEHEEYSYRTFIESIPSFENLEAFADENLNLQAFQNATVRWQQEYFSNVTEHLEFRRSFTDSRNVTNIIWMHLCRKPLQKNGHPGQSTPHFNLNTTDRTGIGLHCTFRTSDSNRSLMH